MDFLPPNQIDLRSVFPRDIGKLKTDTYQPWNVGMQRLSAKHYMRIVAGFRVKYLDDYPDKVWFLFIWPLKRGPLYDKGKPSTGQGAHRMEWWVPRCPYAKFVKQQNFLRRLAEVVGRARSYP